MKAGLGDIVGKTISSVVVVFSIADSVNITIKPKSGGDGGGGCFIDTFCEN